MAGSFPGLWFKLSEETPPSSHSPSVPFMLSPVVVNQVYADPRIREQPNCLFFKILSLCSFRDLLNVCFMPDTSVPAENGRCYPCLHGSFNGEISKMINMRIVIKLQIG